MICWGFFFTELKKVFLPNWKRLQTGLGMVLFFGKSAAGSDLCHRFREQKGWCREIPVPFSHVSSLLAPQIPVPSSVMGETLMALIHLGPKCPYSGSEYPESPLFPSHATGDAFSLPWVNGSCWFHVFLPPPGVGQVRRSSVFSTAFPCWPGQGAEG